MSENKKKICAYDIETLRRKDLTDEVINELCKTGNMTDEKKIAKKRAEFKSMMGANPLLAIPCCGAWHVNDTDCGYIMLEKQTAVAEEKFLREYWERLAMYDVLIGFNSFSFDSKILLLRSAVYGIEIPFRFDRKRYNSAGNHIDIRMILQDWSSFEAGKLGFFLDMFGLDNKTEGMDGSLVQEFWNEGLHKEIGEYCLDDCKRTFELFEKIKRYFL